MPVPVRGGTNKILNDNFLPNGSFMDSFIGGFTNTSFPDMQTSTFTFTRLGLVVASEAGANQNRDTNDPTILRRFADAAITLNIRREGSTYTLMNPTGSFTSSFAARVTTLGFDIPNNGSLPTGALSLNRNELPATLRTLPPIASYSRDIQDFNQINTNAVGARITPSYSFYPDGQPRTNSPFPSAQSFIEGGYTSINNVSSTMPANTAWGQNIISRSQGLLVYFEFVRKDRVMRNDAVAFANAPTATTPTANNSNETALMGVSYDDGLYLSVGRNDGGSVTQTYVEPVQVDNPSWQMPISVNTLNEEAFGLFENLANGTYPIRISTHIFNNDNDVTTHAQNLNLTITASGSTLSINAYNVTFTIDGTLYTVPIALSTDRMTISGIKVDRLRMTATLRNHAFHYVIDMGIVRTSTFNRPNTYAERTIDSGNPYNQIGIFDSTLYDANRVDKVNKVMYLIRPFRARDITTNANDILIGVMPCVNGHLDNSSNGVVNTHRTKSEFDFSHLTMGNGDFAFTRLMVANINAVNDFDMDFPKTKLLEIFNRGAENFFGLLNPRHSHVDTVELSANLSLGDNENLSLQNSSRMIFRN